ncbi:MAG: isoamylase early set domain-containing protein [Thermodesulfobacteriota bacterium]
MATKTTTKKAAAPKSNTPSVEFTLFAPEAATVFLVGDFNGWDPAASPMRRFKDGTFKKSLKLKGGRHEYLFLVDGQWWNDPANGNRAANPYGGENSVIEA